MFSFCDIIGDLEGDAWKEAIASGDQERIAK